MKPNALLGISAMAISAALLLPPSLIAQSSGDEHGREGARHRYKLVDLGTLGGPHSYGPVNAGGERLLNNAGTVSSYADTATPDPNAPDTCVNPDCLVAHAVRWRHGRPVDLGALGDENSSAAGSINDRGWSTGQTATGLVDRVFNIPEFHAVFWRGRRIFDLGSLPGGNTSLGFSINNVGQVVGISNNGVPDPFAMFPTETQVRTFLWEGGELKDIGTLGGPDATPRGAAITSVPASSWGPPTLASHRMPAPEFPPRIHSSGTTAS
jgi:uncharacterized membrane protein